MVSRTFRALRKDRITPSRETLPKNGAVIYCRVSTQDQLENFSITTQQSKCIEFCERNGYTALKTFDEAASAKTPTSPRPQFDAMLDYCRKYRAEVGAVVVYAVTRFARSIQHHANVRSELRELGIRLLSVTENFDDRTSAGRMMENFLSLTAQFDNDQRSERTIAGMRTGIESGKFMHLAPIGYLNADVPGGLAVDTKRAPLVRSAFTMYADGLAKHEVLRRVTALGLTNPKTDRPISPQTFDKLLRNPLYGGWITSSWGITARGAFEPIIDDALFERVEARASGRGDDRQTRSRNNETFPLRVFVRCTACNTGLTGSDSTGRGGKKYGHYTCRNPKCRKVKFRRDDLHNHFISLLHSLFPKREFLPLFAEMVKTAWRVKHADQGRLNEAARHRVATLTAKRQRIIVLVRTGWTGGLG